MVSPEPDSLKRRRIDRYELHELIGEGGMGAVYRAVDSRLGRTVAIKTVVSHRSGDGLTNELRQRFMREALAASKVDHRNVVQVIDFGVTAEGTPYLVMEYLRGRDLGEVLRRAKDQLPIDYVADVMLCVCAALRACHQQGVVHRDLKPSNIFLADTDTGPEVKVLDFGVSKAPMAGDLTQEGQILGTPQYLSPEQVNGKVGPESDQYALGVVLYVCLTKKLPFEEHQNLSLLRAIEIGRFRGPRVHRPEIPPALEAIILRAMHPEPARRLPSVHALGQALWSFASPRGQLEWKNYYLQTPPAPPIDTTLRGIAPPRAGGSSGGAGRHASPPPRALDPPGALDPTAPLLAENVAVPEPRSGASPQLLLSTKLASPALDRPATPPAEPPTRSRRIVPILAGILVAAAVGAGYWHLRAAPLPSPVAAPPPSAPVTASAPPPAPAAPSLPSRPPETVSKPAPPPPPPGAPGATYVRRSKHAAIHKSHATRANDTPNITGLDQNGIGIPSN
jgi:eukaryotic-like serine/threonine-protein kinase